MQGATEVTVDYTNSMIKKIFACFAAVISLFLAISISQAHGSSKSDDSHEAEAPDIDEDREDNSGSGSDDGAEDREDDGDSDSGFGSDDNSDSDDRSSNSGSGSYDSDDDEKSTSSRSGAASAEDQGRRRGGASSEGTVARTEANLEIVENSRGERVRKGELVLLTERANLGRKLASRGFTVIEKFGMPSLGVVGFRIAVPARANSDHMLIRLRSLDPKAVATFNHMYTPSRGEVVAGASAPTAISAPARSPVRARIGLVDARVNANHPMLKNVRISSKTFGIANSSDEDHGTAVASRIAEMAPGANLVVASVFSELDNGQEMASADAIVKAMNWLASSKIPVINLSLTGPANPILEIVTAKLIAKGHLLVAAVGNEGPHGTPQYPAAYKNVVGVTAVDSDNRVYLYANQGDFVDFAAAGVNMRVASKGSELETVSGTSYAAPVIAAALARRLKQPDRVLAWKAEQDLAKSAQDAGEPGRDPVYGFGIIHSHDR